ncbi:topoisomerase II-associated protein PAT1 [Lipomyces arxii]|uniref:topoisomerase II-associated protein PAT1 n=1 Tax=Lipomyces arxii TaxID=56418 RepID=UPI0034CF1871
MSFFGFDPSADPKSRKTDPSFFDANDVDEDRYDSLAEDLDQDYDRLNDETFGGSAESVGRDFDFCAQTAKAVGNAQTDKGKIMFSGQRRQPEPVTNVRFVDKSWNSTAPQEPKVFNIPDLKPMASLWEASPAQLQQVPVAASSQRMLSLEEVEAQIMARKQQQAMQTQQMPPGFQQMPMPPQMSPHIPPPGQFPVMLSQQFGQDASKNMSPSGPFATPSGALLPDGRPPSMYGQQFPRGFPEQESRDLRMYMPPISRGLQNPQVPSSPQILQQQQPQQQQYMRYAQQQEQIQQARPQIQQGLASEPNLAVELTVQPVKSMSSKPRYSSVDVEELPEAIAKTEKEMEQELQATSLSQYNGLMTSSDKNHVTRIQLQQLFTEDPFTEDFYYQVFTALHGNRDGQPSNTEIAEKYLNEYGRRSRYGLRKQQESMQRLQHRAIAAAKAHPKHEQYVVEGALGKIAFSTVKGPRRILDVAKKVAEER